MCQEPPETPQTRCTNPTTGTQVRPPATGWDAVPVQLLSLPPMRNTAALPKVFEVRRRRNQGHPCGRPESW
jgi:hypothetical protein